MMWTVYPEQDLLTGPVGRQLICLAKWRWQSLNPNVNGTHAVYRNYYLDTKKYCYLPGFEPRIFRLEVCSVTIQLETKVVV